MISLLFRLITALVVGGFCIGGVVLIYNFIKTPTFVNAALPFAAFCLARIAYNDLTK
jgi:hypothetical protein